MLSGKVRFSLNLKRDDQNHIATALLHRFGIIS